MAASSFLNLLGEEADDLEVESALKAQQVLVRCLGPTHLDAGEDIPGDLHAPALHPRHQDVLGPVALEPEFSHHPANHIEAAHANLV